MMGFKVAGLRLGSILGVVTLMSACGGGGGDGSAPPSLDPPSATFLSVSYGLKSLQFTWTAASGADFYRLLQDPDGASGYSQVGADLPASATSAEIALSVVFNGWTSARFSLEACNGAGSIRSNDVDAPPDLSAAIGYFKASNPEAGDAFGSVALSGDGTTLAVGAYLESGGATGIGGTESDNTAVSSGAVYVFTRDGGSWAQQAYIKASNTGAGDLFGLDLALSADGDTLAVGARNEDSSATGINGAQGNSSAVDSGAVYVFTRAGGAWTQQAYIKASNTGAGDAFGHSVALSDAGDTLAVGGPNEDGGAVGIGGAESDNSAADSGAVHVFTRTGGAWAQQAYVKASNTGTGDAFGCTLSLSSDGDTLAVGAAGEDSAATGVNGAQADNTRETAGAAYVFTRDADLWAQQAYVKASNTAAFDRFGENLSLDGAGDTLAVGAYFEDGVADSASASGAVYVFEFAGGAWSQQAYLKASNAQYGDSLGTSVALSRDGETLAVGAHVEDGGAVGIGGLESDNSAPDSGAVYVFTRSGGAWLQQAYVKASNTDQDDRFGSVVALSTDGGTLAVGARGEDGGSAGVNGDPLDNSLPSAGAVYLY